MDRQELVVQFCGITSADPVQAESYLQVSDYNLERAIELYFETGGADLSGVVPPSEPPPSLAPRTPSPQDGNVQNNGEDPGGSGTPTQNIDEDEALARRLMQEDVDQTAPTADNNLNNGGVRSPIAAMNDVLVPHDMDYDGYRNPFRRRGGSSRGIFNQGTPSIWNEENTAQSLADATGGYSQTSEKANRLAHMYRRPFELMHRASLEEARNEARSEEPMKWIMVNIMNSQEFVCQMLNRDLWSDRQVQRIIRENFFFLQYTNDEPDGIRYQRMYPFDQHPHISIIDPRTGEQVKTWSKVILPAEFILEIHEFLERFSLNEQARNPIGRKNKIKKTLDMMTEEEQMEAALAASLGQDIGGTSEASPPPEPAPEPAPAMMPSLPLPVPNDEPTIPTTPSATEKVPSLFLSIKPSDTPEPAQSPQTTRIQFRFPEGGRPLVRRFNKTDTIRDVFAFVKGLRDDDEEFELVFVGRRLLAEAEESGEGSLDRSIVDAGLANGSLTVEV